MTDLRELAEFADDEATAYERAAETDSSHEFCLRAKKLRALARLARAVATAPIWTINRAQDENGDPFDLPITEVVSRSTLLAAMEGADGNHEG